ncbi:PQQ-dependent catabolism-associated CXXCW motif protein [Paracoccus spongiarum]|uniref:PQQ-dependent catabolism-associated CXXCW motif protein n=1 Tax=Paracoccus spongiarum TaxID=3064387 RepID=A0ABT9JBE2_9RHOB|nr:PQQ-dependent catabolism-associated CXXCW motif protein [Paracoccus sp. 2205BS29-5]MDP5307040.1 PQQ-dependent catabolism-associated CXXCW motif protein [Paracoccus sp. 2205BS29-5]
MLVLVAALAGPVAAQVPEPDDYRGEPYRAPVPSTLAGAEVVDAAGAIALHAQGVPFVDVLPRKTRPPELPEGTVWREPPHETIPGALWLWNTGYQKLSEVEHARLVDGLEKASGGDLAAPLVIFCRADCWMSWNAARRAVEMGYQRISWFPGGIEQWQAAGGAALVSAEPVAP